MHRYALRDDQWDKIKDLLPGREGHVLSDPPRYPGVQGSARAVRAADAPLLREWLVASHKDAVPHDPPPDPAHVERAAGTGRYFVLDGR